MASLQPTIFIVDDDESVRESLARLVRSEGLNVETFASAEAFLKRTRTDAPGCLLLDVQLPDLNGLDLQRHMAAADDDIPIIFISGKGDIPTTVRAMKDGAVEFLTKPLSDAEVLHSIIEAIARHNATREHHAAAAELRACYGLLTPREKQVMAHVVEGLLNKQIAGELGISEDTVKVHRGHVMRKMKADSLAALVKMAGRLAP
jgi:FixJ family two-component response regulator